MNKIDPKELPSYDPNTGQQQTGDGNAHRVLYSGKTQAPFYDADAICRLESERDQLKAQVAEHMQALRWTRDHELQLAKQRDEARAQVRELLAVVKQAQDALTTIEGKARTMSVRNAYCRTVHAIANVEGSK